MVAPARMLKLISDLKKAIEITKRVFSTAPDIIPSHLEAFVFLPPEQVGEELDRMLKAAPEKARDEVCHMLEQSVAVFEATVTEMENRIKARQQPADVPRREGPRVFKQFKQRKAEW